MGKWFGVVGFSEPQEENGVVKDKIIERKYYGDLTRNIRRVQEAGKVNDNIALNNQISIVADPYALNCFHAIKYVSFMGTLWKVTTVDVQFPRLVLEVGGVWNGEQAQSSSGS